MSTSLPNTHPSFLLWWSYYSRFLYSFFVLVHILYFPAVCVLKRYLNGSIRNVTSLTICLSFFDESLNNFQVPYRIYINYVHLFNLILTTYIGLLIITRIISNLETAYPHPLQIISFILCNVYNILLNRTYSS